MSAPYTTLYLDPQAWDLVADALGNIALASPPYAQTQDVCSACRLFQGELYYDTSQGVPYMRDILGKMPPLNVLQSELSAAAISVPDVESATVVISSFQGRKASGQVQFTTGNGTTLTVAI